MAEQGDKGTVDCPGSHRAHQFPGAMGCAPSSQALPAITVGGCPLTGAQF